MTPSQRSLKLLKDQGYLAQVVERYNMYARVRIDLFGIIDIVAIHPNKKGVLGIQTTSASNFSARLHKAEIIMALKIWLKAGNEFVIHGWGLKGARGKRKTYQLNSKSFTLEDLIEV